VTRTVWQPNFSGLIFRFGGRKAWKKTGQPPKKYQNMKWTRYSSEEMRHKEVDDAMSSWGDSYQVPPLKPQKKHASCGQTRLL